LIAGLKHALTDTASDESIRAIIIRGAGSDFCSGADLASLQKIADSSYEENLEEAKKLADLFIQIRQTPTPVIAAVHGRALAGGAGLATACDIVLATRSARFGYPEVRIGFVPAMVMAILRRSLGEKKAFELSTLGFEFGAEQALEFGLINRVFDDKEFDAGVDQFAQQYSKVSQSSVRLTKQLLYKMDGLNFEDAILAGAETNAEARMTEDCKEGIANFLNK